MGKGFSVEIRQNHERNLRFMGSAAEFMGPAAGIFSNALLKMFYTCLRTPGPHSMLCCKILKLTFLNSIEKRREKYEKK